MTDSPRFIQIHTLHSYPAALLNRDDSGLAKRMRYGGTSRTRVSSQCLKRHWRKADGTHAWSAMDKYIPSIRSREIITKLVVEPLVADMEISDDTRKVLNDELQIGVYGKNAADEKKRQPLLLGLPEVEYLKAQAIEMLNAHALFGRMVTSDPAANIDAAIHVAHSFTVHSEESESDYFTVVDDLQDDDTDDLGAAHIGEMELTAGLFYGYVVVDIPSLVSNTEGISADEWLAADTDRTLAGEIVKRLVHLIATVTPGAKLGSTAPYSWSPFVFLEMGDRQPRSLSDAFRTACAPELSVTLDCLSRTVSSFDECYGAGEARGFMCTEKEFNLPSSDRMPLDDLAKWAGDAITRGAIS